MVIIGLFLGIAYSAVQVDTAASPQTPSAAGESITDISSVRVIDGDTFRYRGEKIRIAGIDAPETHPARCTYEAELGYRATNRLHELLRSGPFTLVPLGRDEDAYGRKLRDVTRNGASIGDQLIAEGLARPYGSGRRPWCAQSV